MKKSIFLIALLFTFYFSFAKNFISTYLNYFKIKSIEIGNKFEEAEENYHSTLISAFIDINRIGRPKEEYFKWIKETQKLNAPMIFFVQKKYEDIILNLFQNRTTPYLIITVELEELPFYKDLEKVQQIINSSQYKSRISSNARIECVNPLYSIVIFSKFSLMKRAALMDPFKSVKFIWMDAGVSRFYGGFNLSLPIIGSRIPNDKYLAVFETRAYSDNYFNRKDLNNLIWSDKNYIQARIMGGTPQVILKVNNLMEKQWNRMISNNVINNEQIGMILSIFEEPDLFRLFNRTTLDDMKEVFSYLV
jgi:hypothetical protein